MLLGSYCHSKNEKYKVWRSVTFENSENFQIRFLNNSDPEIHNFEKFHDVTFSRILVLLITYWLSKISTWWGGLIFTYYIVARDESWFQSHRISPFGTQRAESFLEHFLYVKINYPNILEISLFWIIGKYRRSKDDENRKGLPVNQM